MTFRGDLGRYARVLSRLRDGWPLAQILAGDATLSRSKLAGVVRRLAAKGWIEPSAAFSNLDSDGFGGKRYVVTRKGKVVLKHWAESGVLPRQETGPAAQPVVVGSQLHGRVERPRVRAVGPHAIAFTSVIEEQPVRPLPGERSVPFGGRPGTRRGANVHARIRVRFESISIPVGVQRTAGKVTFRFRGDNPRRPLRSERELAIVAATAVREYERATEARLYPAELVSRPKWSGEGDPFVRQLVKNGETIFPGPGREGADTSPIKEGTIEHDSSDDLHSWATGLRAVGPALKKLKHAERRHAAVGRTVSDRLASLDGRVGRLEGEVAGMRADQGAATAVLERLTGLLEKALTPKAETTAAPARAMTGDDRGAYG